MADERQQPRRLLIIDDAPALLEALSGCLQFRVPGCEIETCSSAQEALTRLIRERYDLILTDLKMPGMDGLAFLDEVKELCPGTSVALMTGHGRGPVKEAAEHKGAIAYVEKPFDREDFTAPLCGCLSLL
ncbi:response regulator [Candidatus Nitrospira bockiana]